MSSYLMLGDKGMRLMNKVKELSRYDNIVMLDKFDPESLENIYLNPIPAVYVINLAEITKKHRTDKIQNSILKFIEEPPGECDVYILMPSVSGILDTIANRCKTIRIPNLSSEFVKSQIEDIPASHLCMIRTYDDIENYDADKCDDILRTCRNMLDYLPRVTVANALQIADKINFDDADDMRYNIEYYNLDWFIYALEYCLVQMVYTEKIDSLTGVNLSKEITWFKSLVKVLGINKRYIFENLILRMMEVFRNANTGNA